MEDTSPIATSVLETEPVASPQQEATERSRDTSVDKWPTLAQAGICISGLICLLGLWKQSHSPDKKDPDSDWLRYILSCIVIIVVVLSVGWVQFHRTTLGPRESPFVTGPHHVRHHHSGNQSCMAGSPCHDGFTCSAHALCTKNAETIPKSMDWTKRLKFEDAVMDQGACGSCWAVAAAQTLQLYAQLVLNKNVDVSPQGMLGCSTNPNECGGQGGCEGSTTELALEWAAQNGIHTTAVQQYTATATCPTSSLRKSPALTIEGYMLLETNKGAQMINALASVGPVLVSIAAGTLHTYGGGVFGGCPKENPVVDHAVMMVGYGEAAGKKYWRIKNSWGNQWGEKGFFRILRHTTAKPTGDAGDAEPCAWDEDPSRGYACRDPITHEYPKKLLVCGECGVLSDSIYPVGIAQGSA